MLLTGITIYHNLNTIVTHFFSALKLQEREHPKGRKPILTNSESVTCAVFKQRQNIATIKSLYDILEPPLSYQKFVDAVNRAEKYLAALIGAIMRILGKEAHVIKFTDSTELPSVSRKTRGIIALCEGVLNGRKAPKAGSMASSFTFLLMRRGGCWRFASPQVTLTTAPYSAG